jgi:hypothetical protein
MSAGRASASPCHRRGPSTTITIDVIGIDRKTAVIEIDVEQSGSVLTDIVAVLDVQLMLDEVIIVVADGGIRHGDLNRGWLTLTLTSSTVPQR